MADLHSFFKRKDPPGGAPGAALKAAKTSSASIAGGVRWSTLTGSLLARVDSASPPNARVAAFDLDDTLQKTRSGKPGYMVTDLAVRLLVRRRPPQNPRAARPGRQDRRLQQPGRRQGRLRG